MKDIIIHDDIIDSKNQRSIKEMLNSVIPDDSEFAFICEALFVAFTAYKNNYDTVTTIVGNQRSMIFVSSGLTVQIKEKKEASDDD